MISVTQPTIHPPSNRSTAQHAPCSEGALCKFDRWTPTGESRHMKNFIADSGKEQYERNPFESEKTQKNNFSPKIDTFSPKGLSSSCESLWSTFSIVKKKSPLKGGFENLHPDP